MNTTNKAWRRICGQVPGDVSSLIYIYNLTGKRECREHVICKVVFWKQSGALCH